MSATCPSFWPRIPARGSFPPLDVRDHAAVLGAMRECDAVMSAIPYYFNIDMARLAVEAGVHFCDLGGNTEIVFKQKELDARRAAEERHRRSRLRARAGHGEHPRASTASRSSTPSSR